MTHINVNMLSTVSAPPNPERRLWQAVLQRVIDDALGFSLDLAGSTPADREFEIARARRYLLWNREDFEWICQAGGFDAAMVRERLRRLLYDNEEAARRVRMARFAAAMARANLSRRPKRLETTR